MDTQHRELIVPTATSVAVLLARARPDLSPSARRRLLAQGQVLLDGRPLTEPTARVQVRDGMELSAGGSGGLWLRT